MSKPKAILYARVSTKAQAEEDRYSLPQQLAALREYAARESYVVPEGHEIVDPGQSGATLERPGMDRVRDLVAAGGVSVVLAQDRDRFAREPAYLYLLKEEFAAHGCELRAMNSRGDDSPEGELQDGVLDQLAKYERAKLTERARRGKLQKARQGRIPVCRPPMGFLYADDGFVVDEPRMAHVRRMFGMLGLEGASMQAVKHAFERDGVATQRGAEHWDATVIRRMIENDVYLARTHEEVAALVSPQVAAGLDPESSYGVFWYNKVRHKRVQKRNVRKNNDPSEWIAVPVPDAGIPREWVEGARAAVKDNARHPDAGRRFWELKSLLFCPCGRRLTTFVARRKYKTKAYTTFHYVCSHRRRHGARACEHARYHTAHEVEGRVRQLIIDLIRRPEVMMEHVREDVEREKERLKNADRERAAWADELAKVERKRDVLIEMRADGDITKEEFRNKVAGLDARKTAAERELGALTASTERLATLETLPGLVEEYIRELPYLVQGPPKTIREYANKEEHCKEDPREEKRCDKDSREIEFEPYLLTPEALRERTPEEIEALRRAEEQKRAKRYRAIYELLDLKIVVQKCGTLEVSGRFGLRSVGRGEESSSVWNSVTRTSAKDLPSPESFLGDEEDRCPNRCSSRHVPFRGSPCARARSGIGRAPPPSCPEDEPLLPTRPSPRRRPARELPGRPPRRVRGL
jgi:site-specific DNA recombinase